MCKSIVAIAGLTAILSLGSLIPAYAGGASSAPSKHARHQLHNHRILFVFGEGV